jgi:hypothetical protein
MKNLLLWINLFSLLIFSINVEAQNQWCGFEDLPCNSDTTKGIRKSSNGYHLPAHGVVRTLVIFLEMVYSDPSIDPSPNGTNEWPAGQLPVWADDLFDHIQPSGEANGLVTRYFQNASSGNKILLGDYLLSPVNGGVFQVQTTNGNASYPSFLIPSVNTQLNNTIVTANGYNSISDFDKWTITEQGLPKIQVGNHKWDNVVFIVRNSSYPEDGCGLGSGSFYSSLLGYSGDSWTIQCTHERIPTNVVRHEYAHNIMGGNNFHAGGGGGGSYGDYWIPTVSGWSMLGLYNCSFLSWNAWDRQRMDWKLAGNQYNPSARNYDNTIEVNGDIDASNPNHAGIYVLRDFVSTGDAIRIKLPFIDPDNEYQQWIWIENRQGINFNNNSFDQWQYQESHSHCVLGSVPGLGIYIQIDKDIRESISASVLYGGHAGYIRPLAANGFWDRDFQLQTVYNTCVAWKNTRPFQRLYPNPLTGGCDQECYTWDLNNNDTIWHDDQLNNHVEYENGLYKMNLFELGHADHIFTLSGNNKLSVSSNPSSVPLMNLVSWDYPPPVKPNVRKIYLNGVSIEILNHDSIGNIQVQIRFDDVDITNDVRWCADEIVLNHIPTQSGYSLNLNSGNSLMLDQGLTATRMDNPITFQGRKIFASPTVMRIKENAVVNLEDSSFFIVNNGSNLILENGSKLIVNHNAEITIKEGSHLYIEECATLVLLGDAKLIVESGATLELSPNAMIFFAKGEQNLEIYPGVIIAPGTLHPTDFAFPSLKITTNVVVEDKVCYIPDILTIKDEATLTLINTTLRFDSPITPIIIEKGGKLVVDNSTLKPACNDFWQGIEVWGDPQASQHTPIYHGMVHIKNGGKIENAVIGVRAGSADTTGKGGGIIVATDAVFVNNGISVMYDPYSYTNSGYFINCTFKQDGELLGQGDQGAFALVKLNDVHYVKFENCDFLNDTDTEHVGCGIESFNSIFRVLGKLTTINDSTFWDYGSFTNLEYGIYATVANATDFAYIKHNNFTDNYKGIYLSGMTGALVMDCNFDINTPFVTDGGYGMYLDNCTGYTIEENIFEHNGESRLGVGLIVNNSGGAPNEIYRNWFTGLQQGVSAQEVNRSFNTVPPPGLQILCCDFNDCDADILIPRSTLRQWGIAPNQGSNSDDPTDMAGNLFDIHSQIPNGDFDDINNHGANINYYYPINNNDDRVKPVDYTTNTVTLCPVDNKIVIWTYPSGCPPNQYGGGGNDESEMSENLMETIQKIDSTEQVYTMLVDGGNTEYLYNEVYSSASPQTMQVYNELMGKSPYLSDTVVGAAIEKEEVIPGAMLRDIMVANPHTAKSDNLLEKVDSRFDPLPDYMKAQILAGRSVVSLKEELESNLALYRLQKSRLINGLIHYYLNAENLSGGNASVINLLQNDCELSSKYRLAMKYIETGNTVQALSVLNALPVEFNMKEQQLAIHYEIVDFYNLAIQLSVQNGGWNSATEAQMLQLHALLQSATPVSAYARNVLMSLGELIYTEPVIVPDLLKSSMDETSYKELIASKAPPVLEVHPNPAKDFILIGWTLDYEQATGSIAIHRTTGELKSSFTFNTPVDKQMIDTGEWPSDAYIITLTMGGKVIESAKLTLVK